MMINTGVGIRALTIVAACAMLLSCGGGGSEGEEKKKVQGPATQEVKADKKYIIFFGNSLTAGFGVEPDEAFPALIQQRLDSLGLPYTVVNAGVSGETTATGNSRVAWVLAQQPVDVFVLELGGNDGLRGIPVSETKKNLLSIIDQVRKAHSGATIILAGMMVPPNMGPAYSKAFLEVYPAVAKEANVKLIPFLLKNVGGEDSLNQADGIHPTPAGHKLVRENVWSVLEGEVR
jgi:acyl-CoA thioesterase-1